MPEPVNAIFTNIEVTLVFVGLALLWPLAFSPRARRQPALLTKWNAPPIDFLVFLWLTFSGGVLLPLIALQVARFAHPGEQAKTILLTGAFQGGMLVGAIASKRFLTRRELPQPIAFPSALVTGAATFLISLPLITVVSLAWEALLKFCDLPLEPQEAVALFTNAKSSGIVGFMIAVATILAPITEELIFRAGIFRFARTRLPRWAALLAPACLFGAMHQSLTSFAPLVALGIIFSLAYERTGLIGTSIVAHALFNLYSVVRIFIDPTAS